MVVSLPPHLLSRCSSSSSSTPFPYRSFTLYYSYLLSPNSTSASSRLVTVAVAAAASLRPLTTDWGHHTGTIDWCETNYSHSRYIAEFVNSLTNFPSIFLGLYGLYHTQKSGIPLRYGLCFLGLSLIGVGSFGFHASLRWEWQLMDELPMVCFS